MWALVNKTTNKPNSIFGMYVTYTSRKQAREVKAVNEKVVKIRWYTA